MAFTNSGTRRADAAAPAPPFRFNGLWQLVTRVPRPAAQGLLALAIYLAVFIIGFGLPLASHLNVPNLRQYWTDPQFYAWSLRWWPYAVSHGINPLFSNQIGAPQGYDLAWASTTPAVDLLMWPVTALFGVLVAYNVMLLALPPVAAWATFVAARRLTGRFWGALLAGAVYGFSPFELIHNWQGQPNLTMIALFPLMVYLVVRWWEGSLGRIAFVVWLTILMALEFYTFNEAFADMTAVWAGGLLIGLAVAGRSGAGRSGASHQRGLAQSGQARRPDRHRLRGLARAGGAVPDLLAAALPGRAQQAAARLLPAVHAPDRADAAADVRPDQVDRPLQPARPQRAR